MAELDISRELRNLKAELKGSDEGSVRHRSRGDTFRAEARAQDRNLRRLQADVAGKSSSSEALETELRRLRKKASQSFSDASPACSPERNPQNNSLVTELRQELSAAQSIARDQSSRIQELENSASPNRNGINDSTSELSLAVADLQQQLSNLQAVANSRQENIERLEGSNAIPPVASEKGLAPFLLAKERTSSTSESKIKELEAKVLDTQALARERYACIARLESELEASSANKFHRGLVVPRDVNKLQQKLLDSQAAVRLSHQRIEQLEQDAKSSEYSFQKSQELIIRLEEEATTEVLTQLKLTDRLDRLEQSEQVEPLPSAVLRDANEPLPSAVLVDANGVRQQLLDVESLARERQHRIANLQSENEAMRPVIDEIPQMRQELWDVQALALKRQQCIEILEGDAERLGSPEQKFLDEAALAHERQLLVENLRVEADATRPVVKILREELVELQNLARERYDCIETLEGGMAKHEALENKLLDLEAIASMRFNCIAQLESDQASQEATKQQLLDVKAIARQKQEHIDQLEQELKRWKGLRQEIFDVQSLASHRQEDLQRELLVVQSIARERHDTIERLELEIAKRDSTEHILLDVQEQKLLDLQTLARQRQELETVAFRTVDELQQELESVAFRNNSNNLREQVLEMQVERVDQLEATIQQTKPQVAALYQELSDAEQLSRDRHLCIARLESEAAEMAATSKKTQSLVEPGGEPEVVLVDTDLQDQLSDVQSLAHERQQRIDCLQSQKEAAQAIIEELERELAEIQALARHRYDCIEQLEGDAAKLESSEQLQLLNLQSLAQERQHHIQYLESETEVARSIIAEVRQELVPPQARLQESYNSTARGSCTITADGRLVALESSGRVEPLPSAVLRDVTLAESSERVEPLPSAVLRDKSLVESSARVSPLSSAVLRVNSVEQELSGLAATHPSGAELQQRLLQAEELLDSQPSSRRLLPTKEFNSLADQDRIRRELYEVQALLEEETSKHQKTEQKLLILQAVSRKRQDQIEQLEQDSTPPSPVKHETLQQELLCAQDAARSAADRIGHIEAEGQASRSLVANLRQELLQAQLDISDKSASIGHIEAEGQASRSLVANLRQELVQTQLEIADKQGRIEEQSKTEQILLDMRSLAQQRLERIYQLEDETRSSVHNGLRGQLSDVQSLAANRQERIEQLERTASVLESDELRHELLHAKALADARQMHIRHLELEAETAKAVAMELVQKKDQCIEQSERRSEQKLLNLESLAVERHERIKHLEEAKAATFEEYTRFQQQLQHGFRKELQNVQVVARESEERIKAAHRAFKTGSNSAMSHEQSPLLVSSLGKAVHLLLHDLADVEKLASAKQGHLNQLEQIPSATSDMKAELSDFLDVEMFVRERRDRINQLEQDAQSLLPSFNSAGGSDVPVDPTFAEKVVKELRHELSDTQMIARGRQECLDKLEAQISKGQHFDNFAVSFSTSAQVTELQQELAGAQELAHFRQECIEQMIKESPAVSAVIYVSELEQKLSDVLKLTQARQECIERLESNAEISNVNSPSARDSRATIQGLHEHIRKIEEEVRDAHALLRRKDVKIQDQEALLEATRNQLSNLWEDAAKRAEYKVAHQEERSHSFSKGSVGTLHDEFIELQRSMQKKDKRISAMEAEVECAALELCKLRAEAVESDSCFLLRRQVSSLMAENAARSGQMTFLDSKREAAEAEARALRDCLAQVVANDVVRPRTRSPPQTGG